MGGWSVVLSLLLLSSAQASVSTGLEQLFTPEFYPLIQGKKIAVLTHHASRNPKGEHLVDLLAAKSGVQLKMIFAPEHGYRSVDDSLLPDSKDPHTGLPVYSLYGPRKAPTPEMLSQIDVVVIDLQNVGMRFYTYPATVVGVLRACAQAGKRVVLLDRPEPLGGMVVEGATLDSSLVNGKLVSLASIPTRHGMTLGEISRLYNDTLGIHADLHVVPMKGWSREMLWQDTGLPWVPSSPALTTVEQVDLYGIFGAVEAMNLSVGRGVNNDRAFHDFGAPWITVEQQAKLVSALQALKLPGLSFSKAAWTPDRAIFQGKPSRGFHVDVTDARALQGSRSSIEVLETMKAVLGAQLDFSKMTTPLGAQWLLDGIVAQKAAGDLMKRAKLESRSFLKERTDALLY